MSLNDVIDGYVAAALWSSNDDSDESGGRSLDDAYSPDDLAPRTQATVRATCKKFIEKNRADIAQFKKATGLGDDQVGHDFWLTRNGHGAGFWDRGAGAVGDRLSKAAKAMGEVYMYVGDDGRLYVSGGRRRRRGR